MSWTARTMVPTVNAVGVGATDAQSSQLRDFGSSWMLGRPEAVSLTQPVSGETGLSLLTLVADDSGTKHAPKRQLNPSDVRRLGHLSIEEDRRRERHDRGDKRVDDAQRHQ